MIRIPVLAWLALLAGAATPALGQAMSDMLDVFNGTGDTMTNIFLGRIFGCKIFPGGVPNCADLDPPVFAAVIGLFNVFCMALGMALFAWNATVGTMQTAHEGKVFGSNWSSLWAPIRTIAAVAMFTPLPAVDNYNAVQLSVSWLVRGSTASASIVWARAATLVLNHQAPVTAPEMAFDQEVLGAAWKLVACQAVTERAVNDYIQNTKKGSSITIQADVRARQFDTLRPDDVNYHETTYSSTDKPYKLHEFGTRADGYAGTGDYPFETCGTIALPAPPEIVRHAETDERWYKAHKEALEAVVGPLRHEADSMLEAATSNPGAAHTAVQARAAGVMLEAGSAYQQILGRALAGIARDSAIAVTDATGRLSGSARERIDLLVAGAYSDTCSRAGGQTTASTLQYICSEAGAGQGWLGAGAWYMHMARFANEANALYNARPEAVHFPEFETQLKAAADVSEIQAGHGWWKRLFGDPSTSDSFKHLADYDEVLRQQWNAAVVIAASVGSRIDGRLIEGAFHEEGINPAMAGWWPDMRGWLAGKTRDWFLPPATVDPMAAVAEFGNAQMVWGLGLLGGGGVTAHLLGAVAKKFPVAGIGEDLGRMAAVVGWALMSSGAFLAFILPMLPFLLWTTAVTGYFILVAEAIIAVNLWAVAHLRMDGHSFAGEAARQGYYLVLALTLSPILMVFGFLLGMAIFKASASLIGIGFDAAMRGITHDQSWVVWLIGMAIIAIVMVIIYVVLAERSFSLVAELPTKILRWVGAGAELGSREDDRIRAGALAAGAAIVSTSQAARQAGVASRQERASRRSREAGDGAPERKA